MFHFLKKTARRGVAALALSTSLAGLASAETLSDALASAYEHSGLLEQNRALLRAADEDVAATTALLRPIVDWFGSVNYDYVGTRSAATGTRTTGWTPDATLGISASILLYDNGASKFAVESSKETVLATRQGLVSVEQQVLFDAVQSFMNVVRDDEIVDLRINNLRLLERELQAAQDRFEVGEVTRTDVALAEARLAGARASLAAAQGDLAASEEFYAAAIGTRPGNLVTPTSLPSAANSIEEAKAVAIRSHPDMLRVQHEILASEFLVNRARAALGPTVRFDSRVSTRRVLDENTFQDGIDLGVTLSGPIYRGGQLSALLRQSMARRDAVRASLHLTRHNIRQQAGTAWSRFIASGSQIQASVRQVEAARIAFEGVREEAKLGARTTLDVLTAEQDLLDAEADRITAQATQIVAAYGVLSSMGLLTVDHLNLRVERYDPEAYYNLVKNAPALRSEQGQKLDRVLKAIGKQ
ncbi:TolC family outer membrane protein [Shimia sp. MMG029]|uniref:TolC family outer membrane protein n=1 Tax=Shimia sp. MMG029 TaxID=3021978 RepID=UPI0022FF0E8E|nr:TolC family outer membrane protein [Shimia sp. MMG029]MDA5558124.1 TolC family outer membrane protein [Shimia sp. MMG029]